MKGLTKTWILEMTSVTSKNKLMCLLTKNERPRAEFRAFDSPGIEWQGKTC